MTSINLRGELYNYDKIAVVAHDAGSANHIFAWLRDIGLGRNKFNVCALGPAEKIFSNDKFFEHWNICSLKEALSDADCLLSGTGWATTIEHDARVISKKDNIYCIAALDHWSNYRERFTFREKECLPDEIWVVDDYAKMLAEEIIPESKILQVPNVFLDKQVASIIRYDIDKKESSNIEISVLYLMEPFHDFWTTTQKSLGEFVAFEYFINNMSMILGDDKKINIFIRPHPSDKDGKYKSLESHKGRVRVFVTEGKALYQEIAQADLIVGCNTYAMAVALAAGKKVVSSLPPEAPRCILPQEGIIHLKEIIGNS